MTSAQKQGLEEALSASIHHLRMAERLLTDAGYAGTAYYMALQADKNDRLLVPGGAQ
jgi:hypothetical protein